MHVDCLCFRFSVLLQTARNISHLFSYVHMWIIFSIYSLWTARVHRCTYLLRIFELLLRLGYGVLGILHKCLKHFFCPYNAYMFFKKNHIYGTADLCYPWVLEMTLLPKTTTSRKMNLTCWFAIWAQFSHAWKKASRRWQCCCIWFFFSTVQSK